MQADLYKNSRFNIIGPKFSDIFFIEGYRDMMVWCGRKIWLLGSKRDRNKDNWCTRWWFLSILLCLRGHKLNWANGRNDSITNRWSGIRWYGLNTADFINKGSRHYALASCFDLILFDCICNVLNFELIVNKSKLHWFTCMNSIKPFNLLHSAELDPQKQELIFIGGTFCINIFNFFTFFSRNFLFDLCW